MENTQAAEAVNPVLLDHDGHTFRVWLYEDGHAQAEVGRIVDKEFEALQELNPMDAQIMADCAKEKGLL